jgi:hypothetical protein
MHCAARRGKRDRKKESVWETLYRDEGMIGKWRGKRRLGQAGSGLQRLEKRGMGLPATRPSFAS